MAENKIVYGLSNVYYAVATIAADGSATYGTPVAIPGAVNLAMDANGERQVFHADNIEYWVDPGNNGYSGTLEIANVPESFETDVLAFADDSKNVRYEDQNAAAVHFALLFQFEGDQKAVKHVLYNNTVSRPGLNGATKEDNITPQTTTLNLEARSIYVAALNKWIPKSKTTDSTDATTYAGWNSDVHIPTAATTGGGTGTT